jgi:peptidoglycan/xylan/chitin deacetylase (PgdA/CDA1 family)
VVIEAARIEPGLVTRIVAEGHTLGLHADVHERLDRSPPRELGARLSAARRELEDLAGRPVRLHRPPFGAVSRGSLRAAHAAGLDVVLWSHDPKDWQETAPDPLTARISRCLEPGAVVALHDGPTDGRPIGTTTAPALQRVATELRRYRLVGL